MSKQMFNFRVMNTPFTIEVPGLLNNKTHKKLIFDAEGFTVEKPRSFDTPVFIPAPNIAGFRYGVSFARGYKFAFGRVFFIEIRDDFNKITRIKLNSYYGIRRKVYTKLWSDIIHKLWSTYFANQYNYYYDLYKIHQTFELCGIQFHFEGIGWDKNNVMLWEDIAISSYRTYFMIYNSQNKKQAKSRSFATDWNAVILQALLKKIVKERNVLQK